MVQDLVKEMATIFLEVFEGVLLGLVGVTPPKRQRHTARTPQTARTTRAAGTRRTSSTLRQNRIVLSERAWLRMSGELVRELPRDEAITVLHAIQRHAANA
ncbi:MAG TPA: hypothetical protein VMV29_19125 [Ktedonobacterales bacterium]|nr:hypothetical protein [Ktedonobacterales bacterium]